MELTTEEENNVLRLQVLASTFAEYLDYYKPLFYDSLERDSIKLPRSQRRNYLSNGKKEFVSLKRIVNGFTRIMENNLPKENEQAIDMLCETLEKIKL